MDLTYKGLYKDIDACDEYLRLCWLLQVHILHYLCTQEKLWYDLKDFLKLTRQQVWLDTNIFIHYWHVKLLMFMSLIGLYIRSTAWIPAFILYHKMLHGGKA